MTFQGIVYKQPITSVFNIPPIRQQTSVREVASQVAQRCGAASGNCRRLLDTSGLFKITCFKANGALTQEPGVLNMVAVAETASWLCCMLPSQTEDEDADFGGITSA